jgi:hypothetical protein
MKKIRDPLYAPTCAPLQGGFGTLAKIGKSYQLFEIAGFLDAGIFGMGKAEGKVAI